MIKIVQVVSDSNIGGAGRYLLNYLKYYDRTGYDVTVIVPEGSLLCEFVQQYSEVHLVEAPFMTDKSFDKRCVKYLKRLFKNIKPDILHTHASLSARIAGRLAKVPCIVATRHCIEPMYSPIKAAVLGFINNRLCDYYIAVAEAVAQNLRDGGISLDKIKTIYNGVEPMRTVLPEAVRLEKTTYGIKDDDFVFGVFARLEKVKGHRYFLKAARELKRAGYRAKFLIVGDGSLLNELKDKAKSLGISDDVIFTGYVKDTTTLLNATDVNVISSESEAMSLAILEAMSVGKPSIATLTGGNPEIVKNGINGYLTVVADSTSLAEAMIKIMSDESIYNEMSSNARKMYEEKFGAKIMVDNLEKFYKEVSGDVY